MNNRDKVVELLKNYRSYRYAVSNGIAPYVSDDLSGMPLGGSYGSRVPTLYRGTWDASGDDYSRYSRVVRLIDGAINEVLDDAERKVISRKYLDRNTTSLAKISEQDDVRYCERHVKRIHKRAITKLSLALTFVEAPNINNLDYHLDVIS